MVFFFKCFGSFMLIERKTFKLTQILHSTIASKQAKLFQLRSEIYLLQFTQFHLNIFLLPLMCSISQRKFFLLKISTNKCCWWTSLRTGVLIFASLNILLSAYLYIANNFTVMPPLMFYLLSTFVTVIAF